MSRLAFILFILTTVSTSIFAQRPPCADEIDALNSSGNSIVFSDTDSSMTYFTQSYNLAIACGDSMGIAKSKNFIGLYHYLKNNYDLATRTYFDALGIAERNGFKKDQGVITNNLGALFFDIADYSSSKLYYETALSIMFDLQDSSWIARIYGNLAGVYFMNKEYDKSIETLNNSIDLGINIQNYAIVGGALSNLAMVHMSLNDNKAAFEAYDRGAFLLDSVGDKRGVCITYQEKASALAQHDRLPEAKKMYVLALKKAKEISHKESMLKSYKGLSNIEEKLGNNLQALNYQKLYTQWKDSVLNEEKIKSLNELNKKYQSEQKGKEIAFLKTESKLKGALVEEKQKERNYLASLALLFLVVILLIVIQLKQKQKLNAELTTKNTIINEALDERETLVKEVHHRVKNNLQIVSSMLNIQASTLDDGNVKDALLESRKRVQSMTIIHQKLYKSDKIGLVDIKEYIEYILSEVESFYDFDENVEIDINTTIEAVEFNIDTTVPLGLIITELVSNAYKHAFNNQKTGSIQVNLSREGNGYCLSVKDNGSGFSDYDFGKAQSFGIKLIKSLAKSLDTEPTWQSEDGTTVYLKFTI